MQNPDSPAWGDGKNPATYLYSFAAYLITLKNGIYKDDRHCFDFGDAEIGKLYPAYDPDTLPESIREWIGNGIWDEDRIIKDVCGAEDNAR